MRGMINIVVGIMFIVWGLSGRLVLIGTHNGPALAIFGGVLVAIGVVRMTRSRTQPRRVLRQGAWREQPGDYLRKAAASRRQPSWAASLRLAESRG